MASVTEITARKSNTEVAEGEPMLPPAANAWVTEAEAASAAINFFMSAIHPVGSNNVDDDQHDPAQDHKKTEGECEGNVEHGHRERHSSRVEAAHQHKRKVDKNLHGGERQAKAQRFAASIVEVATHENLRQVDSIRAQPYRCARGAGND